jgi:XapX domain-containing protein
MLGYLVSLLMGLAVGAAYGLVQVRSPAPPMIALVGLFGMVLVSCRRNNMPFVAIKMGRRQGVRREHI